MGQLGERFWSKVDRRGPDECWEWRASLGGGRNSGYGHFRLGGRTVPAHRVAYELLIGPIPAGLTLDHQCNNRACVNPRHLVPATHQENILRGTAPPAANARKTRCPRGHEYTESNTYRYPDGRRECVICRRAYYRARYQARKAAGLFALLLVLAMPVAVQAKPTFVVQDEASITENGYGLRHRALLAAKNLGATHIRINRLEWHQSDPNAPFAVAASGLKPQLTLAGSLNYLRGEVLRYRTVVDTYGVWNEPDLGVWRCCTAPFVETAGKSKPHRYRSSYPATYRMIKRLDPSAKVMIGELSPHGMGRDLGKPEARTPWFRRVLRRGHPLRADCVAVHPYYWFWSEPMDRQFTAAMKGWKTRIARWAKLRMLLTPRGHRVPVCSTEFGEPVQWRHPGQVRRGYRVCKKLRFKQCAQYQLFPSGQRWDTSLTDEFCQPRPEFLALRRAITGAPTSAPVPWKPCPDAAPFIETPPGPGPYDVYRP